MSRAAVAVLVAAAAVAAKVVVRPRVVIENHLAVPIAVQFRGDPAPAQVLRPGQVWRVAVPAVTRARWTALAPDGRGPLARGELRGGAFAESGVPLLAQRLLFVRVTRAVRPRTAAGAPLVAPVIVNRRARALRWTVVGDDGSQHPCGCTVAANDRAAFAGYVRGVPGRVVVTDLTGRRVAQQRVDAASLGPDGVVEVPVRSARR